jgi:hypothetical protein
VIDVCQHSPRFLKEHSHFGILLSCVCVCVCGTTVVVLNNKSAAGVFFLMLSASAVSLLNAMGAYIIRKSLFGHLDVSRAHDVFVPLKYMCRFLAHKKTVSFGLDLIHSSFLCVLWPRADLIYERWRCRVLGELRYEAIFCV